MWLGFIAIGNIAVWIVRVPQVTRSWSLLIVLLNHISHGSMALVPSRVPDLLIPWRLVNLSSGFPVLDHLREGHLVLLLWCIAILASSTLELLLSALHATVSISSHILHVTVVARICSHHLSKGLLVLGLLIGWPLDYVVSASRLVHILIVVSHWVVVLWWGATRPGAREVSQGCVSWLLWPILSILSEVLGVMHGGWLCHMIVGSLLWSPVWTVWAWLVSHWIVVLILLWPLSLHIIQQELSVVLLCITLVLIHPWVPLLDLLRLSLSRSLVIHYLSKWLLVALSTALVVLVVVCILHVLLVHQFRVEVSFIFGWHLVRVSSRANSLWWLWGSSVCQLLGNLVVLLYELVNFLTDELVLVEEHPDVVLKWLWLGQ